MRTGVSSPEQMLAGWASCAGSPGPFSRAARRPRPPPAPPPICCRGESVSAGRARNRGAAARRWRHGTAISRTCPCQSPRRHRLWHSSRDAALVRRHFLLLSSSCTLAAQSMAAVLSQSLEQVEKECPRQLLEFVECVEAQPHAWQSACESKVRRCERAARLACPREVWGPRRPPCLTASLVGRTAAESGGVLADHRFCPPCPRGFVSPREGYASACYAV